MPTPAKVTWALNHYGRLMRQGQARVKLRTVTRSSGPNPKQNPALVVGGVVDGAHLAGATTLALRGTTLRGRFLLGDIVQIGSLTATVAAPGASDNDLHRITLPLSAGLSAPLNDGAAVTAIFWAADRSLPAKVEAFPLNLIDGEMVLAGDLRIMVAAKDCGATPPRPQDTVMVSLNGAAEEPYTVQAVIPAMEETYAVAYTLQVRRA